MVLRLRESSQEVQDMSQSDPQDADLGRATERNALRKFIYAYAVVPSHLKCCHTFFLKIKDGSAPMPPRGTWRSSAVHSVVVTIECVLKGSHKQLFPHLFDILYS